MILEVDGEYYLGVFDFKDYIYVVPNRYVVGWTGGYEIL